MNIVITGVEGFLGERVSAYFSKENRVIGYGHRDLDITNFDNVVKTLDRNKPDVVIHCAAISDTRYSQNHPNESEAVNLWGTVNVTKACACVGAKLVFMSSDQVYSGCKEPSALSESAATCPDNVYGRHKLEAEQQCLALLPSAVGLRLTWMYDLPSSVFKLRGNLLVNLHSAAVNGTKIKVSPHEMRSITSVWDVVTRLEKAFSLPGGVYNFGCENDQNCYTTFCEAAKAMSLEESVVELDEERFSQQPRNLAICISKLRKEGIDFPSTIEGIKQSLKQRFI